MNFSECWDTVSIGTRVEVSDGTPEPTNPNGNPYKMWRSHNFVGELVEKNGSTPHRVIAFRLDPDPLATLTFAVNESTPHTFVAVI